MRQLLQYPASRERSLLAQRRLSSVSDQLCLLTSAKMPVTTVYTREVHAGNKESIQLAITESRDGLLSESAFKYCSLLKNRIVANLVPKIRLIDYTDPSEEIDDSAAALMIASMVNLGLLSQDKVIVIANQYPAKQRAEIIKAHYQSLGLPDIIVAVGADANEENRKGIVIRKPSYAVENKEPLGKALAIQRHVIDDAIKAGESHSVVHMGHSVFTDIANIIKDNPEKFAKTARAVVIQSGVLIDKKGNPVLDKSSFLQPDPTSFNNMCDLGAAKYMFEMTQRLGVPMVITTKHAADKSVVGKSYLEMLRNTGQKFGGYMYEEAVAHMQKFWEAVQYDVGDPKRPKALPPRLTKDWYLTNVANLKPGTPERLIMDARIAKEGPSALNAWEYTNSVRLYDAQTVASLNYILQLELAEEVFAPEVFKIGTTEHYVIGLSPEKHGIRNKEEMERQTFALSEYALCNAVRHVDLSCHYEEYAGEHAVKSKCLFMSDDRKESTAENKIDKTANDNSKAPPTRNICLTGIAPENKSRSKL